MNRIVVMLAVWVSMSTALVAAEPKPPKGFRALFNGQDLSGCMV